MVRNSNDVEGQGKVAGTPGAGVGVVFFVGRWLIDVLGRVTCLSFCCHEHLERKDSRFLVDL